MAASSNGLLVFRKGRWIDGWDPENFDQWERQGGERIAKRNLIFSVLVEHLGFITWGLWAIVAVQLQVAKDGGPGPFGFAFSSGQVFWLISLPSLIGATLRFPYTFMVAKMGGRNWTIISGTLLLIPTTLLAVAINNHPVDGVGGTSYGVMALVASLAGFGGGNFASSMANITFFYPQRRKGWALGMNAAGGNVGQAVIQFVVPIIISVFAFSSVAGITPEKNGKVINLPLAGWFWIPFIVAAVVCAILFMNNLTSAKSDSAGYVAALKEPHNWILSFLYIGTFGSFIGLSGAFPKLIADNFPNFSSFHLGATAAFSLSFLGPLVGSLIRPFGGWLADRLGGAYVTAVAFGVMIVATLCSILVLRTSSPSFWGFLAVFMILFAATGTGNGSMYKMIPTVYNDKAGQRDAQHRSAGITTERKISASLGIVSAIGAYGGFLIPQVFNQAIKLQGNRVTPGYTLGLWWLFAAYIVFLAIHVAIYIIPYARQGIRV